MTGIELMEVCKERETCEKCPAYKACKKWKEELLKGIEPCELEKIVDEKEF